MKNSYCIVWFPDKFSTWLIIVATLLGLLGHAVAVTSIPEGCQELKDDIMSGFKPNDFFTGDWYLTHARDPEDPPRCEKYQPKPDLQLTFNGKSGSDVTCKGATVSGNPGFYSFQCTSSGGSFTSFMAVVATDYNNYALLYRCGLYDTTLKDNFLVFNRQSSGGIPEGLNPKLSDLDLTSVKKLGCT